MTSGQLWLAVLSAGVVSSLLTVGTLLVVARFYVKRRLEADLARLGERVSPRVREGLEDAAEEMLPRFRDEVRGGFEEAAEGMLPRFRDEVRGGFEDAAEEILPRLREEVEGGVGAAADDAMPRLRDQVREGFKEGLAGAVAGGLLGKRGEELARKGSSVLEAGINILFGGEDEED